LLARRPLDVFDDLLAGASACSSCLSHLPLLSGYDEPRTLSYQMQLFGPIGADVRQFINGLSGERCLGGEFLGMSTRSGGDDLSNFFMSICQIAYPYTNVAGWNGGKLGAR